MENNSGGTIVSVKIEEDLTRMKGKLSIFFVYIGYVLV